MIKNHFVGRNAGSGLGLQMLSEEDKQLIHSAALEVLSQTGMLIDDKECCEVLADIGCEVDFEKKIVKFPHNIVEDAIRTAPSGYLLAGKDEEHDVWLESGRVNFITFGCGIMMRDLYTHERRKTTKQDIVDVCRVTDTLDEFDVIMHTIIAQDVNPDVEAMHNFQAHFANTRKPLLSGGIEERQAKKVIDMAAYYSGGYENLKKRPLFQIGGCTISPMEIPASTCMTIRLGAQYGLPIGITSMAMIGGMSPVTMAGALVETVAEPLGANVLAQALDKGHAFNMNSSTGLNDMRQNAAAMVGCPELALISGAFSQMARWYNIPSMAAGT